MKSFAASILSGLAAIALSAPAAPPELTLAPVFGDNLVLQRGAPLPVWGRAEAGATVSVQFAGQAKMAVADAAGNWKVMLDPLPASAGARTLSIAADNHRPAGLAHRELANVLVGDVWLAAGQSNMEFPLGREAHAAAEIPAATNALIRLLNLPFAGQYFFRQPFGSNELARLTPEKLFHGEWKACSPAAARDFSAIAYYFSREIQRDQNVPVGVIHCAVGGSPTEAWIRRLALESDSELRAMTQGNWFTNAALDDWCRQRGHENLDASLAAGLPVPGDDLGPNHHFKPAFLWDAGPARLAPFALRGVLWYQGESNSLEPRRVRQHESLFPLLVRDWRAAWGRDLPFLFCQLSSIRTNAYQSAGWPEFRDQQRRFLATVPGTGMAVTSDHGLPDDVHPREKREIGRRLALIARARVFVEPVEFSGPQPLAATARGPEVTVAFSHAAGLHASDGGPVNSFELAGDDGVFHPARALLAAAQLALAAPEVRVPRQVRYGWQPFSTGNLVNAAGLPASTFQLLVTTK